MDSAQSDRFWTAGLCVNGVVSKWPFCQQLGYVFMELSQSYHFVKSWFACLSICLNWPFCEQLVCVFMESSQSVFCFFNSGLVCLWSRFKVTLLWTAGVCLCNRHKINLLRAAGLCVYEAVSKWTICEQLLCVVKGSSQWNLLWADNRYHCPLFLSKNCFKIVVMNN